jgi:hypothetical protein
MLFISRLDLFVGHRLHPSILVVKENLYRGEIKIRKILDTAMSAWYM